MTALCMLCLKMHLPGPCTGARPDAPRSGAFNRWYDAYHEARFRADITGRRYRVWFEPNNNWWNITELITRHRATGVKP